MFYCHIGFLIYLAIKSGDCFDTIGAFLTLQCFRLRRFVATQKDLIGPVVFNLVIIELLRLLNLT